MTVRETIGKKFRAYRLACDLTQAAVATHMGLHRPAISEIEGGRRGLGVEELLKAADLFGISFEDIARSSGPAKCPECGRPYVPAASPTPRRPGHDRPPSVDDAALPFGAKGDVLT